MGESRGRVLVIARSDSGGGAGRQAAVKTITVRTPDDLRRAAEALLRAGARAVLVKGGHLPGARVVDVLVTPAGETRYEGARIDSRHTHGTGCTLASAIAARLAQGWRLEAAVAAARDYVRGAIAHAPGFGAGHGPLHHGWAVGPQPSDPNQR